jgi:hypothetical protein
MQPPVKPTTLTVLNCLLAAKDTGVVVSLTLPGTSGLRQYDYFDVSEK